MNELSCRSCGAKLDASRLDRRLAIISCGHCEAIFDLTRRDVRPAQAISVSPVERAPVALPSAFVVERSGGDRLAVSWRWFSPAALLLLFFCIAWDGFLVVWYTNALGTSGSPGTMALLFPIAHVAVGVSLSYSALAKLFNRTTVSLDRQRLSVRHAPLPWLPAPTLPTSELEQLFVKRKVARSKNGETVSYQLHAVTRSDASKKLLGGLETLDQALWLEQEIERTVGLRDRRVAGEVTGTA